MGVWKADELSRVMREVADAMGAHGAALLGYTDEDVPIQVVYYDEQVGLPPELLDRLTSDLGQAPRQDVAQSLLWLDLSVDGENRRSDVLCMPVQSVERHGQLLVCAFFEDVTRQQRETAEAVYQRRRPFATGYFRLWQLEQTYRRHVAGLEAALGLLDVGVVLLDRQARIAFANTTAAALIDAQDGLRRHQSRLGATDLRSSARLRAAVDHVIFQSAAEKRPTRVPLLTVDRANGRPLVVAVYPAAQPANDPADVAAILYVNDPALDTDRLLQPICRLQGLSRLETQLVCLLAAGATLGEAATQMNVKEQTIRGSLRQVFAKTGTRRQADLIRVMLTSVVRTNALFTPEVI